MSMLVWIFILIASVDGALVSVTSTTPKPNKPKCNSGIPNRNVEDIEKEVAVLKNKLQNSEATKDLIKEIAALQAKVQAKEATNDIRALQTKIEAIEGKLEAADRANRIKTTQIEALQNKNAVCEKAETQTKAIEDILQQVAALQARLQENEVNKTTQITNLQSKVQAITGSLSSKQPSNPVVGFHVALANDWTGSGKVPFNKIISNYGNGWNNITHIFNVPTKGLYFLTLTIQNSGSNYAYSWLRSGSNRLGEAWADGGHSYNVGTVSTVVLLNAGEEIYVQHGGGTLNSGSPSHHTYLAGFLIQKYD